MLIWVAPQWTDGGHAELLTADTIASYNEQWFRSFSITYFKQKAPNKVAKIYFTYGRKLAFKSPRGQTKTKEFSCKGESMMYDLSYNNS